MPAIWATQVLEHARPLGGSPRAPRYQTDAAGGVAAEVRHAGGGAVRRASRGRALGRPPTGSRSATARSEAYLPEAAGLDLRRPRGRHARGECRRDADPGVRVSSGRGGGGGDRAGSGASGFRVAGRASRWQRTHPRRSRRRLERVAVDGGEMEQEGRKDGRFEDGTEGPAVPSAILPPFRPSCALAYPWVRIPVFHSGREFEARHVAGEDSSGRSSVAANAERRSARAERRDAGGSHDVEPINASCECPERLFEGTQSHSTRAGRSDARGSTTSNLLQRQPSECREHLLEHRESLHACRASRCERFRVVSDALAAPPCECRERLLEHRESLHACRACDARGSTSSNLLQRHPCECRERLLERRESLHACRASRCERFHVVEPIASATPCECPRASLGTPRVTPRVPSVATRKVATSSNLWPRRSANARACCSKTRVTPRVPSIAMREVPRRRTSRRRCSSNAESVSWNTRSVSSNAESVSSNAESHATRKQTAEDDRTALLPSTCRPGGSTAPRLRARRAGAAKGSPERSSEVVWDNWSAGQGCDVDPDIYPRNSSRLVHC